MEKYVAMVHAYVISMVYACDDLAGQDSQMLKNVWCLLSWKHSV